MLGGIAHLLPQCHPCIEPGRDWKSLMSHKEGTCKQHSCTIPGSLKCELGLNIKGKVVFPLAPILGIWNGFPPFLLESPLYISSPLLLLTSPISTWVFILIPSLNILESCLAICTTACKQQHDIGWAAEQVWREMDICSLLKLEVHTLWIGFICFHGANSHSTCTMQSHDTVQKLDCTTEEARWNHSWGFFR